VALPNEEIAMNRILSATAIAAAAAAASWAVTRWLDTRSQQLARSRKPPLESWENEGGALAPQHAPVETSQVPR
jgi:hypothetical protein